jgi:hypothetical protein
VHLDRRHPGWREDAQRDSTTRSVLSRSGKLTNKGAYQLGLVRGSRDTGRNPAPVKNFIPTKGDLRTSPPASTKRRMCCIDTIDNSEDHCPCSTPRRADSSGRCGHTLDNSSNQFIDFRCARTIARNCEGVTIALCHLVSSYQQFMLGTGVGNVARLCVCLLHSDGHIPSWEIPTMAPLGDNR